jgi:hypothetical protein
VFRTAFGETTVPFDVAFPFVENPPFAADDILHTRQQIEAAQCPRPYEPPSRTRRSVGSWLIDFVIQQAYARRA